MKTITVATCEEIAEILAYAKGTDTTQSDWDRAWKVVHGIKGARGFDGYVWLDVDDAVTQLRKDPSTAVEAEALFNALQNHTFGVGQ